MNINKCIIRFPKNCLNNYIDDYICEEVFETLIGEYNSKFACEDLLADNYFSNKGYTKNNIIYINMFRKININILISELESYNIPHDILDSCDTNNILFRKRIFEENDDIEKINYNIDSFSKIDIDNNIRKIEHYLEDLADDNKRSFCKYDRLENIKNNQSRLLEACNYFAFGDKIILNPSECNDYKDGFINITNNYGENNIYNFLTNKTKLNENTYYSLQLCD